MEHPPKQGLKHQLGLASTGMGIVLMEHPPKQGLKPRKRCNHSGKLQQVLMEHPPKQGLKLKPNLLILFFKSCFNGTSTKTRIETRK